MKPTGIVVLLIFLLAQTGACRLLQYNTNPVRTESVTAFCTTYNRDNVVDDTATEQNDAYIATMQAGFTSSGNDLFVQVLADPAGVLALLPTILTEFIIFCAAFVIGLVLILSMWTCLCCCCCCPTCCPSSCCRNVEGYNYSKCQLIWPTVVLVVALLLAIASSVIGITRSSNIQDTFESFTCATAITLDDLINGNVTTEGTFFTGLEPFATSFAELADNIDLVTTQLGSISSSGTNTAQSQTDSATLLNNIDIIPNGVAGGSLPGFTYNNFDTTVASISSTFPNILGSTNAADSGSQTYIVYNKLEGVQQVMDEIISSTDSFVASVGDFNSSVADVKKTVNDLVDTLAQFDTSFYNIGQGILTPMETVTLVVTVFFGIIIGFGVLGIVGALVMTFCSKYSCRYLVYFVCVILFIIGIVCFLLSFIFSLLTPLLYYSCDFLAFSAESGANFESNFGSLLGTDTVEMISVCMPGQSGDIVSTVGGGATDSLNSLSDSLNLMEAFDTSDLQTTTQDAWDDFGTFVNDYYRGRILDFDSSSNLNILKDLADPSNYPGCTVNSFQSDSWIPTILASGEISCAVSGGNKVDNTQCPDSTEIGGGAGGGAGLCTGCLDTYMVLLQSGAPLTDLQTRYGTGGDADCDTWENAMGDVWDEYYSVRDTSILTVETDTNAQDTNVANYVTLIATVGTDIDNAFSSLDSTISSVVDPQYGLVAGFNCLIFGEDFKMLINTLCVRFFNMAYLMRLTLGITGFGILFSMCCTVCTGVRHYKQSLIKVQDNSRPFEDPTMANFNNLSRKD